jgi:hypothetical protein
MTRWLKLCVVVAAVAGGMLPLTGCQRPGCCRGFPGPCFTC